MASFGENLRALRTSRGLSQDKFARIIGSNQVSVSSWEVGSRTPNMATIKGIAATFGVPVSTLVSFEDSGLEEDYVREVADILQHDPKVRLLFDRAKYLSPSDLDTVLAVIGAITKERVSNE